MRGDDSWLVYLSLHGGRGIEAAVGDGTYGARDDGDLVDGPCGFLLEELLDDETADVAGAYDCEPSEVRHDTGLVDGWMKRVEHTLMRRAE